MKLLYARLSKVFPKSLVHEFYTLFGEDDTDKLFTIFAGCTIRVPSTKEVNKAVRDLTIYEFLVIADKDPKAFRVRRRQIQSKYNLSKRRIRSIYNYMKRLHREAKEVMAADADISKHKKVKIKGRKRKKWLS